MANRDYICFDFETGSRNPHKTQPTQLAAIALDGRTLQMKGQFNSEIKPIFDDEKAIAAGFDPIQDEALKITKKTRVTSCLRW
jgi:DNA polymerase III epsilon subunit-like protein